jgi:glycerophosphoryl diester phosphodiesterase
MRGSAANPFLAGKRRPIVVGHRGVPLRHQENTLAGFRRAVALGIPAIELDVRLTADRRAVVLHDSDLLRLTGTARDVIDLTWDQVSRLRIRRELPMGVDVHGAPVVVRYEQPERIPLLAEVLAELADKIAINIELKLDLPRWWQVDVAEVVAAEIARAGAQDRVIVTSFDPRKLRAVGRVCPGLAFGFCFDDTMLDFASRLLDGRWALGRLLDSHVVGRLLGSRLVGAEHTLVGHNTVNRLHQLGVAIGTHTLFPLGSTTGKRIAATASTIGEVERLVALGVDWIETDDPERLMTLLA